MSTAQAAIRVCPEGQENQEVTLLELVQAICEATDNDREVVSTVLHLLRSGRVSLSGNFRGSGVEAF